MSIKSFAYQLSLKSNNEIKRSQCYELFAAAHSYKSYAAIDIVVDLPEHRSIRIDNELLSARSRTFGLDPDLVTTWMTELMAEHSLKPFTFIHLANHLECVFTGEIQPYIDAILPQAQAGNGMAHFCLALLYSKKDYFEPESDYWYQQRISGKALSKIENEYADEYQRFHENKRLAITHLNAAADLGNVSALIKLALRHGDQRILDIKVDLSNTDICLPWGVDEIAQYALSKGRRDEYHRWLTYGCEDADTDALFQLATSLANEKPASALSLIKFASLLGTDLTQSRNRAIDEHGEDYDDDIGGAMYVEEIEGVNIENVTGSEVESAERLAKEWFRQYKAHGRASISIE